MFDAENESMDSGLASELAEAAPSSSAVDGRVASASPPNGRHYSSLRGKRSFGEVYYSGKRRHSGGVTVISGPRRDGEPVVGIVASRKKVGGAVDRNRAKRRIKAALDGQQLENRSYIVIASRHVLEAEFDVLARWLEAGLVEEESAVE